MSCSVHDVIRFEKMGVPTANIGTDAFVEEGEEQARLLGMPDYETVWLPHPVAILTEGEVRDLARQKAREIADHLLG